MTTAGESPFRQVGGSLLDPDGTEGTFWENGSYQVIRRERPSGPFGRMIHLTIRSVDGSARHDWRDFQRIKNALVGPETEAVEIYPAEGRLVDTANHYHLWVFPDYRFPFGMEQREISGPEPGISQRPFSHQSECGDSFAAPGELSAQEPDR